MRDDDRRSGSSRRRRRQGAQSSDNETQGPPAPGRRWPRRSLPQNLGEMDRAGLWLETNPIAQWQAMQNIYGTVGNLPAIAPGTLGFGVSDEGYTTFPIRNPFLRDVSTPDQAGERIQRAIQERAMREWAEGQRLGYMPETALDYPAPYGTTNQRFAVNEIAQGTAQRPPVRDIDWQARQYEFQDLLSTLPTHLGTTERYPPPWETQQIAPEATGGGGYNSMVQAMLAAMSAPPRERRRYSR